MNGRVFQISILAPFQGEPEFLVRVKAHSIVKTIIEANNLSDSVGRGAGVFVFNCWIDEVTGFLGKIQCRQQEDSADE